MSTATTGTDDTLHAALEDQFGLADRVVDEATLAASVARFKERGIVMPTFAQLADPALMPAGDLAGDRKSVV